MKTRIITGIIFTIITAALVLPGAEIPQIPIFAFFIIAAICIIEVSSVLKVKLPGISQARCVIGSIGVFIPLIPILTKGDLNWRLVTTYVTVSPNRLQTERDLIIRYVTESLSFFMLFFLLVAFMVTFYAIISKGPLYLIDSLTEPVVIFYVVVPLFCGMILLLFIPNGFLWFLAGLIISWVSDVFAYFSGVTMGKHKIVPNISPKKTWEGTLGGVAGSILIMLVWMTIIMDRPDILEKTAIYRISFGVVSGIILSIVSQFGDWFASSVKRWSQVKDFGRILPGHGGLTDRFDGVFFTFPAMTIFALIYYLA